MRGTHSLNRCGYFFERFIPVGAGNSAKGLYKTGFLSVYPRGCGELHISPNMPHITLGLSPWVRGTHHVATLISSSHRFIPVGAGNSFSEGGNLDSMAVYPRGCGELRRYNNHFRIDIGLSPWVRGTQRISSGSSWILRFIPVGAGNS